MAFVDELDRWVAHMLEISPGYRRAYYRLMWRSPRPIHQGAEYRRRTRRR